MRTNLVFLFIFLLIGIQSEAQLFKISGYVLDENRERLALASVEIKELKKGTVSRDNGYYEFFLERGKYDLVVSMVGYKTMVRTFYINNEDISEIIQMEADQSQNLQEVVIKVRSRDRAEEIIRKTIGIKGTILEAVGNYSANAYIRAFQLDSTIRKEGDTSYVIDYNKMALTEVSLHFDRNDMGQVKETRMGVKKMGPTEGLFYLTTTDGDFYLYDNLIHAPPVSKIPFISPLSNSGLLAYRFKTIKIDRIARPKIYTIAIRPRQLSNATIEGEISIQDSTFNVISAEFRLPQEHMPEYDYMSVRQEYEKVGDHARLISTQKFTYFTKTKKGRVFGETLVVYSDYDLKKIFKRGYFGNEVSITTQEAYVKDSSFWKSVRTEPLSRQQELYARYQDSIYRYTRTEAYLDSMDRILNKITWKKMLIFGQIFNDHKKERTWIIPPITSVIQPIAFGGARFKLAAAFRKTYSSRKTLSLEADINYGFRNHDVNGMISLERMVDPFLRSKFKISAGRNFEFVYPGDAWVNVLKRSNIYLNNSFEVGHEIQLFNGVHLFNKMEVALRRSVADYKVGNNTNNLFGIRNEPAIDFLSYNATYSETKIYLTPKLRYIREPKEKIFLGSRYPTLYALWRKGINGLFKSEINFDYVELGLIQTINFGVLGVTSYTLKSGDFITIKDLRMIDYKFMRKGDPLLFQNPQQSFQALDSTFPVFDRFYQGNLVHEFNGALINKIPFFKKLKLQEIAGAGFLYAPERNLKYAEFFAGIERIFKWPFNPLARVKLGAYVITSVANKFNNPVQFKIGLTTWDRFRNRWR